MFMILILVIAVVESVITFYLTKLVLDAFQGIRKVKFRNALIKLFSHPIVIFIVNFGVSNMILIFTGAGMIAGAANLMASVIIGLSFKPLYNLTRRKV